MAVFEGAADLPRELAGRALAEPAVADDIVEHLATRDVLKDHVVVVGVDHHLGHATDERMMEEKDNGSLADRPDLLRGFLGDSARDERRRRWWRSR